MAQLGLDFNLKNAVITVLILVIVSFGLGYCAGKGGFNGSPTNRNKSLDID